LPPALAATRLEHAMSSPIPWTASETATINLLKANLARKLLACAIMYKARIQERGFSIRDRSEVELATFAGRRAWEAFEAMYARDAIKTMSTPEAELEALLLTAGGRTMALRDIVDAYEERDRSPMPGTPFQDTEIMESMERTIRSIVAMTPRLGVAGVSSPAAREVNCRPPEERKCLP
jgi:hypothetical protein